MYESFFLTTSAKLEVKRLKKCNWSVNVNQDSSRCSNPSTSDAKTIIIMDKIHIYCLTGWIIDFSSPKHKNTIHTFKTSCAAFLSLMTACSMNLVFVKISG